MLSIYKASAGSGKTFTLAYEYIKLLLGYKDTDGKYRLHKDPRSRHRNILAITFTNKATDEMKRRIVHELAVLAGKEPYWNAPSPYMDRLSNCFGCPERDIKDAAERALKQILFDFGFFQVSTIDSFFQTILRTFAREAELTGNYELDLDNNRAISFGVNELFKSLNVNSGSGEIRVMIKWITDYLIAELNEGRPVSLFNKSSKVHERFLKLIHDMSDDTFSSHYNELMAYLSDGSRIERFNESVNNAIESERSMTRSLCRIALGIIAGRTPFCVGSVSKNLMTQIEYCAETGVEKTPARTSAAKVLDDVLSAFTKPLQRYLSDNPDPELTDAIYEACESITVGRYRIKLLNEIRKSFFVMGILAGVYKYIEEFRAENNTLLLSDTNALLRDIIGDDDAPFIYERVGVWFEHFLIDEFQDTSRMQWDNLRPLLAEGLAYDRDSLIIGDEKQCIYRFRFSDPTLLQHQVEEDFRGRIAVTGNDESGNTNWRSSRDVVLFNNAFFSAAARNYGFTEIYANVCQQVPASNSGHGGYVVLREISPKGSEIGFFEDSLEYMFKEMTRQLQSGYKPSDIVVLTRRNDNAAKIIDFLMHRFSEDAAFNGIGVISDDALSIRNAPSVRLIISIMRYLAAPEQPAVSASDMLQRRFFRPRDLSAMVNRFEYAVSTGSSPEEALRRAVSVRDDGDDAIKNVAGSMNCFNLLSLVECIVGTYIPDEVARDENMFISAFQDAVSDYCSYGACDLHSFLVWWDAEGCRSKVAAPVDENAVRVMTIHKSKGLEFKCVHIPAVDWSLVGFSDVEWFEAVAIPGIPSDVMPPLIPVKPFAEMSHTGFAEQYSRRTREQLLDELNVLYVAFTRAVDELVVSYVTPSASSSVSAPEVIACALRELKKVADGDGTVAFGAPTKAQCDSVGRRSIAVPSVVMDMPPYRTAVRDDLWKNTRIDRDTPESEARSRGIALHDVLSLVKDADSLVWAVNTAVSRGAVTDAERDAVMSLLDSGIHSKDVAGWFSGYKRLLRERPITLSGGERRRPDRVVWTADGYIDIVDYKFGAEHPDKYAAQVKAYVNAFTDMGYENVRGFLWYVDEGRVIQV